MNINDLTKQLMERLKRNETFLGMLRAFEEQTFELVRQEAAVLVAAAVPGTMLDGMAVSVVDKLLSEIQTKVQSATTAPVSANPPAPVAANPGAPAKNPNDRGMRRS